MIFCSIASGSKGNAYLIKIDSFYVLVDVGISYKKIKEAFIYKSIDIKDLKAVIVTHEHSDHVKGLRILTKENPHVEVYMSRGTLEGLKENYLPMGDVKYIKEGEEFFIESLKIEPFKLHHDTKEPLGFLLSDNRGKLAIVTDTGKICQNIFNMIWDVDLLILESNHEENMVRVCNRPYEIKRRILSDYGHISNSTASNLIKHIILKRKNFGLGYIGILLAHLSQENNSSDIALMTANSMLRIENLVNKNICGIDVLYQDQISEDFEI